ncbi:unnamed protein product [Thelazia callipaeda]|uniref:Rhodanese domain-containing protein n=1 Tax=Thelazia callipaeda TaxID=103827 RepID=A0A0N5CWH5_THECL|nr:unnamed protein product [Thelazia callipaeda]
MPMSDRWFIKSPQLYHARQGPSNQNNYHNGIPEMHKEYEDPEYYYSRPPDLPQKPTPPPLPPINSLQKIVPTHFVIEHKQRKGWNLRVAILGCLLAVMATLFILSLLYFLILEPGKSSNTKIALQSITSNAQSQYNERGLHIDSTPLLPSKNAIDVEVTSSFLLTMLITKRKLCLFEVGTDRMAESKREYRKEHIESARLLEFANLSENGIPKHPLHFQRYARSLGIDEDCHLILYDRGEVIWATFAFWIFTLFGHPKVSLYSGGLNEWKRLKTNSPQYKTESGDGIYLQYNGHFRAQWNTDKFLTQVICTFDDVLTNMELKIYDLVDAQDREHYEGISSDAVHGHIRSAVNIPTGDIFNWNSHKWHDELYMKDHFHSRKLVESRPVIVYSATAIRSSLTWLALRKSGYNSSIYFGSWPEWLIRAPEILKIIPKRKL